MINYLKDIKKETLIGQLPDIINSNNESIRNEFNWIFDSSLNRLTKSVYAPTGSVKSHFGEFVNLACEYFTVKNTDSIKASIQDSVESIINETLNVSSMQIVMAALTNIANSSFIDPKQYDISALCDISTLIVNHNVLNNRLKDIDFIDDDKHDFCHDAASIVYEKENGQYVTVKDVLDNINNASLGEVYDIVKYCDSSIINIKNDIQNINSNIESIDSSIQDVYEKLYKGIPYIEHDGTISDITIMPNTYNVWKNISTDIIISPNIPNNTNIVYEYMFRIKYNSNYQITLNFGNLKWALPNGAPVFINNHIYEISIIDELASYIEYN